jgi:SAM-dependent methyltransferase
MSSAVRPHVPLRPIWLCRSCARPWPCPVARTRLTIEYATDPVALHVYLGTVLQHAIDDLYRLNPQPGPDPAAMYARFLAWARPRLRIAGAYGPAMAGSAVPERLRWAVRTMAVAPSDHLLEIGCGTGLAISLICDRLIDGRITAIDRSATAIRQAERRNRGHVSSGRAIVRVGTLADSDLDGERFDKIFAVDVNLFWARSPATELAIVRRLLKPAGGLYLCYEPPGADRAAELARRLPVVLTEHGFSTSTVTSTTTRAGSLLCVTGQLTDGTRGGGCRAP